MLEDDPKKPSCIWLGDAGCVSVQVQAGCFTLGTMTHPRETEYSGRFVQTGLFLKIEDADELASLIAKVKAAHAKHFAPVTEESVAP